MTLGVFLIIKIKVELMSVINSRYQRVAIVPSETSSIEQNFIEHNADKWGDLSTKYQMLIAKIKLNILKVPS